MIEEQSGPRRIGRSAAVVGVLAAGLALIGGCATTRPGRPPVGPHFSIMTYNVNWGMPRADLAIAAIAEADPDVVCLQETTPDWQWALTRTLASRYPHRAFRHYGGAGGMAVLSKLPFQTRAYVKPKAGWFPAWVITVETPLGPVQVCNVHLRPSLSDRGSMTPAAYFSTKDIRRDEVRSAWEHLDPAVAAVIVGDFNEGDDGRALTWLTEKGFTNAVARFDTRKNTWRWRWGLITLRDRFDHILHSPALRAASARIIQKGASDHFPVMAVLEKADARRSPEEGHQAPSDSAGIGLVVGGLSQQAFFGDDAEGHQRHDGRGGPESPYRGRRGGQTAGGDHGHFAKVGRVTHQRVRPAPHDVAEGGQDGEVQPEREEGGYCERSARDERCVGREGPLARRRGEFYRGAGNDEAGQGQRDDLKRSVADHRTAEKEQHAHARVEGGNGYAGRGQPAWPGLGQAEDRPTQNRQPHQGISQAFRCGRRVARCVNRPRMTSQKHSSKGL